MVLFRSSKCGNLIGNLLPQLSTVLATNSVCKLIVVGFHSSTPKLDETPADNESTNSKPFTTGSVTYVQGQYRDKIREYFYFIDHQGFLYLDDSRMKNFTSCFKDKKFLHFFYSRVRQNATGRYIPEFPYISPCGRELNFIRGDDVPIVFTAIKNGTDLVWGNVDELCIPFDPSLIYMSVENGRIYHPYPRKYPYVGLIASKIGIEISNNFVFDSNKIPVAFKWDGQEHKLKNDCKLLLEKVHEKSKQKAE